MAWHPLGWKAVAFSEIEKFPSQVLAHHYPDVPNVGDMTKFKEWNLGSDVDVFVGGTPCQSFSVAGLRKGLDDPRGNLMLTYLAIADKYRPRWLVWENVPGVLSSNSGKDFGVFLGALGELGYGFAYRVLDAQYFGVAQRRRRVFVVGYLGDWRPAAAVLFERHSLSGHPAPSREKRKAVAASVTSGIESCGLSNDGIKPQWWDGGDLAATITTKSDDQRMPDKANAQLVMQPIPIHDQATRYAGKNGDKTMGKGNGLGVGHPGEPMNTLTKGDRHAVAQPISFHPTQDPISNHEICHSLGANSNATAAVAKPIGTDLYNGAITGDIACTMGTPGSSSNASGPTVMQSIDCLGGLHPNAAIAQNQSPTLTNAMGAGGGHVPVVNHMAVRRLTPIECERLQGFPDNYTNIKEKCPDGPRYKALGNSMAVPVMAWIGQRINEVEQICKQNK